jgi:hypothetical protein
MYSFREQPVTWLFLIATACVDAVGVSHDFEQPWLGALAMGQIYAASIWLVHGLSHRLARAGVFVATIVILASPDFLLGQNRAGEWRLVLATLMTFAFTTALLCWIVVQIRRNHVRESETPTPWRFSIVELLGWMIVVAVVSAVFPDARFVHLQANTWVQMLILSECTSIALLAAAFLPAHRPPWMMGAIGAGMAWITSITCRLYTVSQPMLFVHSLSFIFVGLWMLVQRLDASIVRGRPAELIKNDGRDWR